MVVSVNRKLAHTKNAVHWPLFKILLPAFRSLLGQIEERPPQYNADLPAEGEQVFCCYLSAIRFEGWILNVKINVL